MAYYINIPENSYRSPVMDVIRLLKDREQSSYDRAQHIFVDTMATDYTLFNNVLHRRAKAVTVLYFDQSASYQILSQTVMTI